MFVKHPKLLGQGLLVAALVASFGGLGLAHAAGTGTGATTGTSVPPPATINPGSPTPASTPLSTSTPATGVPGNPDGSCPASAPVKVSKSRIYHVTEDPNYKNTKARRCFEDAQAAQKAGYRAPKK
jgi:hypothetical protein